MAATPAPHAARPGSGGGVPGGCFATVLAAAVLAVVGPIAAAVRGWQAWRRGGDWLIVVRRRPSDRSDDTAEARLDLTADIPRRTGAAFPNRLTDAVVRVAEALRRPDDAFHHIYRLAGEPESVLLPVGPQVQELGERVRLALGQTELEGRTALWLTLPARQPITSLGAARAIDPDGEGQPDGLVERSRARWAMATSWARVGPSTVYRVVLWVPESMADTIERILQNLRR